MLNTGSEEQITGGKIPCPVMRGMSFSYSEIYGKKGVWAE